MDTQVDSYYWELGDGTITNDRFPKITYLDSGFYDITLAAFSENGCRDTLIVSDAIEVFPRPVAGFSTDDEEYLMVDPSVEITDHSVGATQWYYEFEDGSSSGDQNPIHTYQEDGRYSITQTVYNDDGCDDETWELILIKPDVAFYIPNSFTPNNDGINEEFLGKGVGIQEYTMMIFDRWGELLYHTANMDKGWDGNVNGIPAESGMYVYRFELVDIKNLVHEYSGRVFLHR